MIESIDTAYGYDKSREKRRNVTQIIFEEKDKKFQIPICEQR